MNLKNIFKDRTIAFYIGLGAAAAALIADILYIGLDYGDVTFSIATFAFVLIGALSEIAVVLLGWDFLILIPVVLCSIGFGIFVYTVIPSITDLFTQVNFYGGNQTLAIAFFVIFLITTLCSIVTVFFNQKSNKA